MKDYYYYDYYCYYDYYYYHDCEFISGGSQAPDLGGARASLTFAKVL